MQGLKEKFYLRLWRYLFMLGKFFLGGFVKFYLKKSLSEHVKKKFKLRKTILEIIFLLNWVNRFFYK